MRTGKRLLLLWMLILALLLSACAPAGVESTGADSTGISQNTESTKATEVDLDYEAPTGSALAELPKYTYDTYADLWDMDGDAHMVMFKATDSTGYTSYQQDLKDAGFELYTSNEIVENLYSTWITDSVTVTEMYIPSMKQVSIVAEPRTNLIPLESDNVWEDKGVSNVYTMVSTNTTKDDTNGMCYIYRLADGSFIIEDSGHNQEAQADEIYNALRELAPDPDNIVIAAWFISHAHSDHVGGFYKFSKKYADKVKLEMLVYNLPTDKSFELTNCSMKHRQNLIDAAARFEGVVTVKAHPGQEFYIRDAKIQVLYSVEMFKYRDLTWMNNSSLVLKVELADTVILQLGDCGPDQSRIVLNAYGDYLHCDIQQVAHHGYTGATKELNTTIDATVALWPVSVSQYKKYYKCDYNVPLMDCEYTYVAGTNTTMIPLPFDPDTVTTRVAFELD